MVLLRSGAGSGCNVRALPVGGACSLTDPRMGGGTRALLLQQTGAHHPRSAFSPHRVTFPLCRSHRTRNPHLPPGNNNQRRADGKGREGREPATGKLDRKLLITAPLFLPGLEECCCCTARFSLKASCCTKEGEQQQEPRTVVRDGLQPQRRSEGLRRTVELDLKLPRV